MLLAIVVQTANILGIFSNPFEFEGDYGSEINPIRKEVFELVVSPEALSKNLSDAEVLEWMGEDSATEQEIEGCKTLLIEQAAEKEKEYGPTLSQLVPQNLINELKKKQVELQNKGFTKQDLGNILHFLKQYQDLKPFHFLRTTPTGFLGLDKVLRDRAAREGKPFDLPILGSIGQLQGKNGYELKKKLLDALFNEKTLSLTTSQDTLNLSLDELNADYAKNLLGSSANNEDLKIFTSKAGQLFLFWIYQALDLHLIADKSSEMIEKVNKVKDLFNRTLGSSVARAELFRNNLITSDSGVLFTQESDAFVSQLLTENGLFLPVDAQNPHDGTLIFLRSDLWEQYQVIPVQQYEKSGAMNVILATIKQTGERFLLASCHGHSTKPEDGRRQISLVMKIFHELSQQENLQLLIGTDANTKTQKDAQMFKEHLDSLGLVATDVGPTTVKRRMVTVQHAKAGRFAMDQEDYLITLKTNAGSHFYFNDITVGFKKGRADIHKPLPNRENPSDHYAIGGTLCRKSLP